MGVHHREYQASCAEGDVLIFSDANREGEAPPEPRVTE